MCRYSRGGFRTKPSISDGAFCENRNGIQPFFAKNFHLRMMELYLNTPPYMRHDFQFGTIQSITKSQNES